MMLDERFARLRTHRSNIARYRRLIGSPWKNVFSEDS